MELPSFADVLDTLDNAPDVSAPSLEQAIQAEIAWLKERWGKFSGSRSISLMGGEKQVKQVEINDVVKRVALMIIAEMPSDKFSESTGLPDLRYLNKRLTDIDMGKVTSDQRDYLHAESIPADTLSTGAKSYARNVAIERMTTFEHQDSFLSRAVEYGKKTEKLSVLDTEDKLGIKIEDANTDQQFSQTTQDWDGHTPDGSVYAENGELAGIGKHGRFESKSPDTKTHIKYQQITDAQSLKEIEPRYYWQCCHYMLDPKYTFVLFVSYDPRFNEDSEGMQNHMALIVPDKKDVEKLRVKTAAAIQYSKDFIFETMQNVAKNKAAIEQIGSILRGD